MTVGINMVGLLCNRSVALESSTTCNRQVAYDGRSMDRIATSPMKTLPRVERTVELGVPATELWRHLVDGELASLWMGGS